MKVVLRNPKGKRLKTAKKVIREDIEVVLALEKKEINANGTYPVGDGYAGIGEVAVNVSGGGTDSPLPIEISTEAEMTELLESGEVGGVYKYTGTTGTYKNGALCVLADSSGNKFWRKLRFESEELYLTFSSPNSFTLNVVDNTKYWDGVLEYSTDTITWNEWDGTTTLSADSGKLYMRGTGNTYLSFAGASSTKARWVLTGSEISCMGNIENLLDYETVARGRHPAMAEDCYCGLFYNCTSLITAPELPATTLTLGCYADMFRGCTSLTIAPELPATTMADYCYYDMFLGCTNLITAPPELPATTMALQCCKRMFDGCTSLVTAPKLPATTLAEGCYLQMFQGCTSLITAPKLPATTLAKSCYSSMFQSCDNLITTPELPATTLAKSCYYSMFSYCASLTTAPELPAATLAEGCYFSMFQSCDNLITAPELPAATLTKDCYLQMFSGCTSLVTAPKLPATTLAEGCYLSMFQSCDNLITAPELPATTLAGECYHNMFNGCTNIKLSETQTDDYQIEYRIPTSGTGTIGSSSLTNMFSNTGGTFTGTPEINTIYYLHTSNSVV